MTDERVIATLNELIETSKDGERGFALAAKEAREPELISVFTEAEQSCRAASAELQDQVRLLGGFAEERGSKRAAAQRQWLRIMSCMRSRDSKAILEECERGEDRAKARYADALKNDLPASVHLLLERQYRDVVASHDRVRDLRNRFRDNLAPSDPIERLTAEGVKR